MAIPYVRASFWRLFERSGACVLVAYLVRGIVSDARSKKRWDFRHRAGDVVHHELISPTQTPVQDAAQFAQLIDKAEAVHVRRVDRKRWPQVAMNLVVALPPDGETSLDEAIEILRAIIDRVFAGFRLLIYYVIHEPAALAQNTTGRRHAHVIIALREVLPNGELSATKLRDLFGRVRTARRTDGQSFSKFMEGTSWPDVSRDAQTRLFAEMGIDLAVDPISPEPQKHWNAKVWKNNQDRVRAHRAANQEKAIAAVRGDPEKLIAQMLRGRALLPVGEIRKAVENVIASDVEQSQLVDRILSHPKVACFGSKSAPKTHVTTRDAADLLERAREHIERSTAGGSIFLARAPNGPHVAERLGLACARTLRGPADASSAVRVIIAGETKAHADGYAPPSSCGAVERVTIDSLSLHPNQPAIVVVPRAEVTTDLQLALAIEKTASAGVRLLLGFDESRADGVGGKRLAAWIANRLAPRRRGSPRPCDVGAEAARLLQAGLIAPAIRLLSRHGYLRFRGRARRQSPVEFTVSDDKSRIPALARSANHRRRATQQRVKLNTSRGRVRLALEEHVVLEQTDYQHMPPIVRQGNLATVVDIDPRHSTLKVALQSGATINIDLAQYPHVRPAHVLSIREARRAPPQSSMRVEMTMDLYCYACLLLAAKHPGPVSLDISPKVAKNLTELIEVAERNLPAVLPWDLKIHHHAQAEQRAEAIKSPGQTISDIDPNAHAVDPEPQSHEEVVGDDMVRPPFKLENTFPQPSDDDDWWEANAPRPEQPVHQPKAVPIPHSLPPSIRGTIATRSEVRHGFEQLSRALAPNAPNRRETADRIIGICGAQSPMARLVRAFVPDKTSVRRGAMDEIDLPADLAALAQNDTLSLWEKWVLASDLSLMALACGPFGTTPRHTAPRPTQPISPTEIPPQVWNRMVTSYLNRGWLESSQGSLPLENACVTFPLGPVPFEENESDGAFSVDPPQ